MEPSVIVALLTLANSCVTGFMAWKLRTVSHQLNGMRGELEDVARKEGVIEGEQGERRRHDDARDQLRERAMERGRRYLAEDEAHITHVERGGPAA